MNSHNFRALRSKPTAVPAARRRLRKWIPGFLTLRPLKIFSFLAAIAGIQTAVPTEAAVNMISVEHRVWGDAGASPTWNTYDEAGPVPLFGNISGFSYIPGTTINYASSSASDWSVNADREGDANYANSYARNTYIFEPYSRELSISLSGQIGIWWFENHAEMTLTDLSSNPQAIICHYQSPSLTGINPFPGQDDMQVHSIIWEATVAVDPEHQYELVIEASAHRGEGGDGLAFLSLSPFPAPEPGINLLAAVTLALACSRRKRPQAV